mgnify:CR=1 FL=1
MANNKELAPITSAIEQILDEASWPPLDIEEAEEIIKQAREARIKRIQEMTE